MLQLTQPVSVGFLSFLVDKLIETSCMCSSFPQQGLTGPLKKKTKKNLHPLIESVNWNIHVRCQFDSNLTSGWGVNQWKVTTACLQDNLL